MRSPTRRVGLLVAATALAFLLPLSASHAAEAAKDADKAPSSTTPIIKKQDIDKLAPTGDQGWCCVDGKVFTAPEKECLSQKGQFSKNRNKVEALCATQQQGYCCVKGDVKSMTRRQCDAFNGAFTQNKAKAVDICAQERGWCCVDGEVKSATRMQCNRGKGVFAADRGAADKACAVQQGWCCVDGRVVPATRSQCAQRKGAVFTTNQAKAMDICRAQTGWCCVDGEVFGAGTRECKAKQGAYFSDRNEAESSCRQEGPIGGKTLMKKEMPEIQAEPDRKITPRIAAPPEDSKKIRKLPEGVFGRRVIPRPAPGEEGGEGGGEEGGAVAPISGGAGEPVNYRFITTPHWAMTPIDGEYSDIDYAFTCDGPGCSDVYSLTVALRVGGTTVDTDEHTRSAGEMALRDRSGRIGADSVCGATVELVLDPDNEIDETDEGDNTWTSTVECIDRPDTEKPDLSVMAWFSPTPLADDETVRFDYQVRNSARFGEAAAGTFKVGLRIGDSITRNRRHDGLASGATLDASFDRTIHCDDGPISIVVDYLDEVDEGDETNNEFNGGGGVVSWECFPSRNNLRISLLGTSDFNPNVSAGRAEDFVADVLSYRTNPHDVRVRCGVEGGDVLYDHTFSSLPESETIGGGVRGERVRFSATLCPADRTFTVYCEADPDNDIEETDETDNRQTFVVTTVPDPAGTCP